MFWTRALGVPSIPLGLRDIAFYFGKLLEMKRIATFLFIFLSISFAQNGAAILELLSLELSKPVFATHAGDGSERLFIVQLGGHVRIFGNGELLEEPFFGLGGRLTAQVGEQGFYSLAFHPDYADNGRFFVSYTEHDTADIVVIEHRVTDNPNRADLDAFSKELLRLPPVEPFHHGGGLAFGPDGYLYIGLGDTVFTIDYLRTLPNAQDLESLAGKILRIDVDNGDPYAIPEDNPFVNVAGARGEIYALGFRNPWKLTFDKETGDLYAVDVGNDRWEEVNKVEAGANYGWHAKEGPECFEYYDTYELVDPDCPNSEAYTPPLAYYAHLAQDELGGNAAVGGYVYRGERYPNWHGIYFFGDFVSGRIWSLDTTTDTTTGTTTDTPQATVRLLQDLDQPVSSFAQDEVGELYVLTMDGGLYHLALSDD